MSGGRLVVSLSALLIALVLNGCSSDHTAPRLDGDCSSVFGSAATDAEGSCTGADGTIHVAGTDCDSGPKLMLAEREGGEDYAWARVNEEWHLLTAEATNTAPFRTCTGG